MAIGCVLLAAGQSKRMGQPKQWMTVNGQPLVGIALQNYRKLHPLAVVIDLRMPKVVEPRVAKVIAPRIVVDVGPQVGMVIDPTMGIEDLVIQAGAIPVPNEHSELGQGMSIRLGVEALLAWERENGTRLTGILCGVIDQPLLEPTVIEALCDTFTDIGSEKAIVQPLYGPQKEVGNPVLFGRHWAEALRCIEGDQGGRVILKGEGKPYVQHIWLDRERPIHSGSDVDTQEDYERIVGKGEAYETNCSHT